VETNLEPVPAPAEPAPAATEDHRGPRWRRILAIVLVVLACITLLVSVIGVWAKRTVLDTNRFGTIVEDVVSDPDVTNAVAARVATEVTTALQDSGRIEETLPSALGRAEPIILAALGGFIEDQTAQLLASDRVQQLLVGAAETAHRAALRLLEGDGLFDTEALTVTDGTVTLNLVPLAQEVLLRLQERGVIPSDVDLPAPGEQVTVPDQVASVADALGVQLDDDFGQVTVYESESLANAQATVAEAQRLLAIVQRAVVAIVILTLVLIALALLVSTNRWRTLAQLGIGFALVMALAIVIVNRVVENVPETIQAPGARAATATLLESATASLRRGVILVALIGLAMALVGYLFGRSESAQELRGRTAGGAAGAAGWARRAVGAHPDGIKVAVLAVAAVVLLVWGLSWPSLIVAAVIGIGGLVAVAALTPSAPPAPA
jgi:hypothetical protein